MSIPTLASVTEYLGDQLQGQWTDEQITAALSAELATAANRLNLPAEVDEWPADLVEAIHRRTARNLAVRGLPLGFQADADGGAVRVGGYDGEASRLEAPFRKVVIG